MINKKLKLEAKMLHNANMEALRCGEEDIHSFVILIFKKPIKNFEGKKIPNPTNRVVINPAWTDENKHEVSMGIGNMVSKVRNKLECVVFGTDTWLVESDKKYDFENEPRPREHPDRKDALLTIATLPDLTEFYSIMQTYERMGEGVKFNKAKTASKNNGRHFIIEKLLGYYGN